MIKLKCVQDADRICKMIRREKEEPDTDRSAEELIAEQKRLYPDDEDSEKEPERLYYSHTMDGHSSGSWIHTPEGFGYDKDHTTLTRLSERKRR